MTLANIPQRAAMTMYYLCDTKLGGGVGYSQENRWNAETLIDKNTGTFPS